MASPHGEPGTGARSRRPSSALIQFSSGIDGRSEAGGADALRTWWRRRRGASNDRAGRRRSASRRLVAAAVPRHGAHRLPALALVSGPDRCADRAGARSWRVPRCGCAPSRSSAATLSAGAELRLRAVRAQRVARRRPGGRRPVELALRARTAPSRSRRRCCAVRRALRAVGLRRARADAGVRPLRGVPGGDLHAAGPRSRAPRSHDAARVASVGSPRCRASTSDVPRRPHLRARPVADDGATSAIPTRPARTLESGWLDTGDLGFRARRRAVRAAGAPRT